MSTSPEVTKVYAVRTALGEKPVFVIDEPHPLTARLTKSGIRSESVIGGVALEITNCGGRVLPDAISAAIQKTLWAHSLIACSSGAPATPVDDTPRAPETTCFAFGLRRVNKMKGKTPPASDEAVRQFIIDLRKALKHAAPT